MATVQKCPFGGLKAQIMLRFPGFQPQVLCIRILPGGSWGVSCALELVEQSLKLLNVDISRLVKTQCFKGIDNLQSSPRNTFDYPPKQI